MLIEKELAKLKRLAKDKMGNYKKIIDSSKKERDNFRKKKLDTEKEKMIKLQGMSCKMQRGNPYSFETYWPS